VGGGKVLKRREEALVIPLLKLCKQRDDRLEHFGAGSKRGFGFLVLKQFHAVFRQFAQKMNHAGNIRKLFHANLD